jgi:hypothetical protein
MWVGFLDSCFRMVDEPIPALKLLAAPAPPTIVHLSIRQHPISTADDPLKKGVGSDSDSAGGCCGCIIS